MFVIKRNSEKEEVSFDKVLTRVKNLSNGLLVNVHEVAQKVCTRIYDGVKTSELDELAAYICSSMIIEHPDYGTLASRIIISNHHKNTSPSFSETIGILYSNTDINGNHSPLISDDLYKIVTQHKEKLNSYIDYNRDYSFDYFGFKTLERAYLTRVKNKIVERPQQMLMRVALGIHGFDIKDALQTYDLMSQKYFTHATPTLFNAGTRVPQLSSCFLEAMEDDSIDGIFNTLKDCALISKYAGGIGLHVHNIRARNANIRGTNGTSTGLVPMLRVFNNTARYVNQCFTPETLVYTCLGPKHIKDIIPYSTVLTSDGTFRRVNQVMKKVVNEELVKIEIEHGFQTISCTKVHEIFCKKSNGDTLYVSAGTLSEGDMLGFPVPKLEFDIEELDVDICKFYGLLQRLGEIDHVTGKMHIYLVGEFNKWMCDFLDRNKASYYFTDESKLMIGLSPYSMLHILLGTVVTLYDNYGQKQLYPCWSNLPYDKTIAILEGFIDAQRCDEYDDGFVSIDISSQSLASSLRYQFLRLGILTKVTTGKTTDYALIIPKDFKSKIDKAVNIIWTPIVKIDTTSYKGFVYDLNVEDNHNYTTDIGIVHNSGKRNGSIAVYLEPWHADVEMFLEMRRPHGAEEERARDLFYALWIPDLFMKRVKEGGTWSLMCPDTSKGLSDVYGQEFDELYERYEREGKYCKQMRAQDLWFKILESQIETGTPYMLYKDACNSKSNQKNLGIIKSSNLCAEIVQYSSEEETAVCNLASVCLPSYVKDGQFDHEKLHQVVKVVVKNLNKVIDVSFYPIEKARISNLRHRPIGIGVQGLADVFAMLSLPFESDEARQLNKEIFETIYHAAVDSSVDLSEKYGPYESFNGSPASQGLLQFDLWNATPGDRYDWNEVKKRMKQFGIRNSLLVAPMPTASTSQVMGYNEAFEPFTSNLYQRKTLAGEFIVINKYLVAELTKIGLWNGDIRTKILVNEGSIQNIDEIPSHIRCVYKTVWQIKQRTLIDMAADRGIYVDQSQSMNLFVQNPNFQILTSMHFYAFSKGLKCGLYYLRTKSNVSAQKFTIDPNTAKNIQETCEACSA
jgi:ribonucleoside-diphosphate reductase alpha subunit